jgi:hypothetical protein
MIHIENDDLVVFEVDEILDDFNLVEHLLILVIYEI